MSSPELHSELEQARVFLTNLPEDVRYKIPAWRTEFKRVYALLVGGQWFVFRPATLRESNTAVSISHADLAPDYIGTGGFDIKRSSRDIALYNISWRMIPRNPYLGLAQEYLLQQTLLHPVCYRPKPADPAYIVNSLCKVIWDKSVFTDACSMSNLLDMRRREMEMSVDDALILFICAGMGFKPAEVEAMDAVEFARHVIMTEKLTNTPAPVSFGKPKGPQRMVPSQEQRQLAADRAGLNRPAARERLGANHPDKKVEQLRRVRPYLGDGPIELAGVADNSAPGGRIDFQKENKELGDIMRDV